MFIIAELNEYIEILDKRLEKKKQKDVCGLVAKKVRKLGNPSSSTPPTDAPSWAIHHQGSVVTIYNCDVIDII